MKVRALLLTVMAVSALAAGQASAHAKLVSSNPAAAATVAAPKTITLTFNEKLVPAFSKFDLTMPEMNGMKMTVKTAVSKDGKSIVGTPSAALPKGAYKIVWTAGSADGHKMNGEVAFKVG